MERLTDKVTNIENGNVLAYRLKRDVNSIKAYRKLGELEDLEEQGRLIVLPCAIGDDVYMIPSKANYDLNVLHRKEEFNRVYHQKVDRIHLDNEYWWLECDKDREWGTGRILVDVLFCETWFLSLAEAEKALAEMEK